jgi:signal transduction histidine kinase
MTASDARSSRPRQTPHAWPILVALGLVAFLLFMMVVADLGVARRVASRTSEMIDDEQRSIELVDDMREQAERMASLGLREDELVGVAQQIALDARAYEPLTFQPGEREEWRRLRMDLSGLESQVRSRDAAAIRERIAHIRSSVHRLAVINRDAAREQAQAIRLIHRQAMKSDALVGLLTLALVATIVLFILRVLARQRALTEQHINLLSERNRELDAFAGRAAHDLRVPLSPIRGYADLLMAGQETPESVHKMAARIRTAVDRMTRVVENMLELSRAGRPSPGSGSLARVVAEVIEELRPQLSDAQVTTSVADDIVACSPSVLAQLLRNLVTNSVKFQPQQRRLVLVVKTAAHANDVELIIEDNGIGMNDEDLSHAFEPYYRGSEHREVPGLGLGLAIVQKTMTALGGTCRLTRSSFGGTAVTLSFPRAASASSGTAAGGAQQPPADEAD